MKKYLVIFVLLFTTMNIYAGEYQSENRKQEVCTHRAEWMANTWGVAHNGHKHSMENAIAQIDKEITSDGQTLQNNGLAVIHKALNKDSKKDAAMYVWAWCMDNYPDVFAE